MDAIEDAHLNDPVAVTPRVERLPRTGRPFTSKPRRADRTTRMDRCKTWMRPGWQSI
jgi:hypothetical protein